MREARPPVPVEALLAQREWVRSLARGLARDEAGADDLEQQAWLDALRSPPRAGNLRGWFARVLRRRARDAWRGSVRRARHEERAPPAGGAAPPPPDEVVGRAESHRLVVEQVLLLPEPYRTTILLRYFESMEAREVAACTGVPPETARTRLRRGLAMLRERLDGPDGRGRAAWVLLLPAGIGGEGVGRRPAAGSVAGTAAAAAVAWGGAAMGAKAIAAVGGAGLAAGLLLGFSAAALREEPPPRVVRVEVPVEAAPAPSLPPPPERPRPVREAAAAPPPPAPAPPPPPPPPPPADPVPPVEGLVRTVEGRGVPGAVVLLVPVEASTGLPSRGADPPSDEEVRLFVETVRRVRVPGCVEVRTRRDGSWSADVERERSYWAWAFADALAVRCAKGSSVRDVKAGASVTFDAWSDPSDPWRVILRDGEKPWRDRYQALRRMRALKEGVRDEDVEAIRALLLEGEPGKDRHLVLIEMTGAGVEGWAAVLVEVLRGDREERDREAAILGCGGFLEDAPLRLALEEAAERDVSPRIRTEAAKVLEAKPVRRR